MSSGSWLFPKGVDRERMLEMDRQLQSVRRTSFGVLALALVASGPWLGWWTLIPLGVAGVLFRIADARIGETSRPEYALFAAWAGSQMIIAISVALTGGPLVPTMSWFAIPVVTLGARFSERGIAVGVAYSIVLMLAVAFGVNAGAVFDNPPLLIAPVALIISIAMFQTVLMRSDVKYRAEAAIDPLTGMLNRKALLLRVEEVEQQSLVTKQPVAIVLGDIDHFKRINDSEGHSVGDAVLKDVGYQLRRALRAFDLFYRIGGEEFLVLLPGADAETASRVAEALRSALASSPMAGYAVTMSFGVAASAPGDRFDYESIFVQADRALYEAKRGGRNRVCPPPGRVVTAAA
jgi:diguanylate cyclase (GGDEF)-like protein